jgi:hypothetical protein
MMRSLLCVGLLAAAANAQVTDTSRANPGTVFSERVAVSAITGTLAALPFVYFGLYDTGPGAMMPAGLVYLVTVSVATSKVGDSRSPCENLLGPSFVGALAGLGVAAGVLSAVHGTHMKGMGAALQVSPILLATPVGAAIGAGRCEREHRNRRELRERRLR